ncbi:Fc.00g040120.m01.CDS01 [Cosmosporella sp. VM-42]
MVAKDSDLSNSKDRYDFMLATTQDSINTILKQYLASLAQTDTSQARCNGTDPFSLPADVDIKSPQIQNFQQAGFIAGIRITLCLTQNFDDPSGSTPEHPPPRSPQFYRIQRRADKRNNAWIFKAEVGLKLDTATSDVLPPPVQDGPKNLNGVPDGAQRLSFNFSITKRRPAPTADGLDSSSAASALITNSSTSSYFSQLEQPVLSYTTLDKYQNTPLMPTDMALHVSLAVSQLTSGLRTPDLLCATQDHPLPPAAGLSWNWINPGDATQCDWVMAVNRNTFTQYILTGLSDAATSASFQP